ncbi:MAG: hypothetical protein NZ533_12060 [Casimicrobiaceae bacterium]|nr:hypothetical protein [Casimicrobiaceae bacterium]
MRSYKLTEKREIMSKPTLNLEGLVQKKGEAQPPPALPQGTSTPAGDEPRSRALTLKLSERNYQRLRRYAFERRSSHQAVIEQAVLEYLARKGAE